MKKMFENYRVIEKQRWLPSYKMENFGLKTSMQPYPKINLYQFLEQSAFNYPTRTAIIQDREYITYKTLKNRVDRLANAFVSLKIRKGDILSSILDSSIGMVIAFYAGMKVGVIFNPINNFYPSLDFTKKLKESSTRVLLCESKHLRKLEKYLKKSQIKTILVNGQANFPTLPLFFNRFDQKIKILELNYLINTHDPLDYKVRIDPVEDVAFLSFTGGTTGVPKSTIHTHYNMTTNTRQTIHWSLDSIKNHLIGKAISMICAPIYHMFGNMAVHSSFSWGMTIVLMDAHDMERMVSEIPKIKPNMIFAVPAHYSFFLEHNFESPTTIYFSGTAPLPFKLVEQFEEKFGVPIIDGYGATETTGGVTLNISALARTLGYDVPLQPGIGVPLPDIEVQLRQYQEKQNDLTSQSTSDLSQIGEFCIKGPQNMKGYWNQGQIILNTKDWIPMGEIIKIDENGYFHVVGRVKNIINVSGNKVYSGMVEEILEQHPHIKRVCLIGIPDPLREGQECVKAFIQLERDYKNILSKQDVRAFLKGKIQYYAMPKEIEFLQQIPETPLLKSDKKSLKQLSQMRSKVDESL